MALTANVVWRVRVSGVQTNGGGYDATVSGAGTDYSDQDAPQLSITDLTSTNSTTCTSVSAGFTAAMVGNILRLASATGSPVADASGSRYLMITGYTNATTITVDKVSGTYTAGVAKVGGAHASLASYSNGGSATAPTLTTPLLAGHVIMVRGSGADDPSSADYTQTGYYQFPNGDTTSGDIKLIGYNGRPMFSVDGLSLYFLAGWRISGIKYKASASSNGTLGIINSGNLATPQNARVRVDNVYIDANGQDIVGAYGPSVMNSRFTNSGSTSAGTATLAAIICGTFNTPVIGNFIKQWRGSGVYLPSEMGAVVNNIIVSCKQQGIRVVNPDGYSCLLLGNTINACSSDGIYLTDAATIGCAQIMNNILTANGGYGLNCVAGSATVNDKLMGARADYNDYGTGATANTSGARNNLSAGSHDLALDPQFTNTATDDYSVGTNVKATGFPSTFPT